MEGDGGRELLRSSSRNSEKYFEKSWYGIKNHNTPYILMIVPKSIYYYT